MGCGTGAFTKEILKTLRDGDEFHIVELNKKFCDAIEDSLLKQFSKENPEIEVVLHNTPIEEAGLQGKFDAIICGLPFNNFPIKFVRHLFDVMFGFLKPGCELAYFEYLGMLKLKRLFGPSGVRKETKVQSVPVYRPSSETPVQNRPVGSSRHKGASESARVRSGLSGNTSTESFLDCS